jgi:hypothetical protein
MRPGIIHPWNDSASRLAPAVSRDWSERVLVDLQGLDELAQADNLQDFPHSRGGAQEP